MEFYIYKMIQSKLQTHWSNFVIYEKNFHDEKDYK